ncbi:MAG: NUDIX hydrolase [Candidatus Odinarchaeum yellowstonii]|jgi:mutator protein MutT|uniref:NUDIX hydrolase n=1 Tax=Odinarchaeota yellowstonii (strain LCB_4) TaxID=1841599 RepID=A0AAF0D3G7_ODILC|nr:MAG: NUDIX hydrolase [Candidatus Odinarchaeum yellowstonii]
MLVELSIVWLKLKMTGRVYPSQPVIGVGVVIMKDERILLVKRRNEPGKGKWAIPGGVVQVGERLESAAIREIKEETNLKVTLGDVAGVFDYIEYDERGAIKFHYIIIDFFANSVEGTPQPSSDVEDLTWIDFKEAHRYELTSSTKKLIQKILNSKIRK